MRRRVPAKAGGRCAILRADRATDSVGGRVSTNLIGSGASRCCHSPAPMPSIGGLARGAPLPDDVRRVLTGTAEGITAIIAIGNSLRRDDGAGTYVAEKVRVPPNFQVFNAGQQPESFVETVISLKPAAVVFIDAADFGGSTGEIRTIPEAAIPDTGMSTHALSLKFVYALLKENTGARITFIGIQTADIGFGEGLSPEIRRACDTIIALLGKVGRRSTRCRARTRQSARKRRNG